MERCPRIVSSQRLIHPVGLAIRLARRGAEPTSGSVKRLTPQRGLISFSGREHLLEKDGLRLRGRGPYEGPVETAPLGCTCPQGMLGTVCLHGRLKEVALIIVGGGLIGGVFKPEGSVSL